MKKTLKIIVIELKTKTGRKAIKRHLKDCDKLVVKWSLKKLGIVQIEKKNSLEIIYNKPEYLILPKSGFVTTALKNIVTIHTAMNKNGAEKEKDYSVNIIERDLE